MQSVVCPHSAHMAALGVGARCARKHAVCLTRFLFMELIEYVFEIILRIDDDLIVFDWEGLL